MKVLLVDIDSTIPNLALEKIRKYHEDRGDNVSEGECFPMFAPSYDKVYVSCIFDWNKSKCEEWEGIANVEIGGSGYSLDSKLPSEIEQIKPKINWGFTTRGCIRKCYFCVVPQKEGNIHAVGDVYDIWDGESKEVVIMDNNILAMPEHFRKIADQLNSENIKVDFNQGLDHRLLTPELAEVIMSIKHRKQIRFAYDHPSYTPTVLKALKMMKDAGMGNGKSRWYVYVGEDDTFATVYSRLQLLREHNQDAYLMRDRKIAKQPLWISLSKWSNNCCGAFKQDLRDLVIKSKEFDKRREMILDEIDKYEKENG